MDSRDRSRSPAREADLQIRNRSDDSVVNSAYNTRTSSHSSRHQSSASEISSKLSLTSISLYGMVQSPSGAPSNGPRLATQHHSSDAPPSGPRATMLQGRNFQPYNQGNGRLSSGYQPASSANGSCNGPGGSIPHSVTQDSKPATKLPPIGPYGTNPQGHGKGHGNNVPAQNGHTIVSYSANGTRGNYGSHGAHGSHGSHGSHGPHGAHGSYGAYGAHSAHGGHGTHSAYGAHNPHGPHAYHGGGTGGGSNGVNSPYRSSGQGLGPRYNPPSRTVFVDGFNGMRSYENLQGNHQRDGARWVQGGYGSNPSGRNGQMVNFNHGSENNRQEIIRGGPTLPETVPVPDNGQAINLFTPSRQNTKVESEITVFTNHFEVQSLPSIEIFQYDIRVTADLKNSDGPLDQDEAKQCSPTMVRRVMEHEDIKRGVGYGFVFDGVSIGWSTQKLPFKNDPHRIPIQLQGSRPGRTFGCNVDISFTGKLNTASFINWLQKDIRRPASLLDVADFSKEEQVEICLKFLNALLRADPSKRFKTGLGNKSTAYFENAPGTEMTFLSNRVLQAWRGFYQTISVRFGKLTVNVDTTTAAFIVPGIKFLDAICSLTGIGLGEIQDPFYYKQRRGLIDAAIRKFVGVGFKTNHIKEGPKKDLVRRMTRMTNYGASEEKFDIRRFYEDPNTGETTVVMERISIAKYYQQQYTITLKCPHLPMAETKRGEKFPLELCFVAEFERWKETLQGNETAEFIKFAATLPPVRKNQVLESVQKLGWHNQRQLKEFGVSIKPAFMEVDASLLKCVVPQYKNDRYRGGCRDRGRWNLGGKEFIEPQTITSWGLIYFPGHSRRGEDQLKGFSELCQREFRRYGITIPSDPPLIAFGDLQGELSKIIVGHLTKIQSVTKVRPNIIVFMLGEKSPGLYSELKRICDTQFGIASQCMLVDKAMKEERGQSQYLGNVAMKINVKLGGINSIINDPVLQGAATLVIGCDAAYPNPSQLRMIPPPPAFIALAANYDAHCAKFTAVTDSQDPLDQKILNFKGLVKELIDRYTQKVCAPERIIYFRDGLSEGRFGSELKIELEELKELTHVPITVVNCVKRHHTRFFPTPGPYADKKGNVLPGTVVENGNGKDIFLVAHVALQGTARPTHYVAVHDENNLSASQFQGLCNNLCYGYGRSTTAVSMVPPVYYARLACERARLHMTDNNKSGILQLAQTSRNLKFSMWWQ